jgi:hypothetical protein
MSLKRAEAYANEYAIRHLKRIKVEMIEEGKTRKATLADWYRQISYQGDYRAS